MQYWAESGIQTNFSNTKLDFGASPENFNWLIEGENTEVLTHLKQCDWVKNKVDLIYIDPPFATNNNFWIGEDRISTMSSSQNGQLAYSDKLQGEEFLHFLYQRFLLLKDLLSEQGSIYVHTDYKIGHYVKILLDEIFGIDAFKNDISRIKCNPKNFGRRAYGNVKDMILFYTKTNNYIWNEIKAGYTEADKIKLFPKIDAVGRRYTTIPLHAPSETKNGKTALPFRHLLPPKGRHWRTSVETLELWDKEGRLEWSSKGNPRKKLYFEESEGKKIQDIWEYKDPAQVIYPTEKNADLLELIIQTSSNEGSLVLDCFCGSGTTLKAASQFQRAWIGIDKSTAAIAACEQKLNATPMDIFTSGRNHKYIKLSSH